MKRKPRTEAQKKARQRRQMKRWRAEHPNYFKEWQAANRGYVTEMKRVYRAFKRASTADDALIAAQTKRLKRKRERQWRNTSTPGISSKTAISMARLSERKSTGRHTTRPATGATRSRS